VVDVEDVEEAVTKTKMNQEVEEATELLVTNLTLEVEAAVEAEEEAETKIKTEMTTRSHTNKRNLKIQLRINSTVCSEHQLLRTTKSRW